MGGRRGLTVIPTPFSLFNREDWHKSLHGKKKDFMARKDQREREGRERAPTVRAGKV